MYELLEGTCSDHSKVHIGEVINRLVRQYHYTECYILHMIHNDLKRPQSKIYYVTPIV